ncbi:uncharacterized protein [Panulirus ornatus]|uniref:uncharacterized protein n=1 Tax=Panulirus ornatus TaxID=150431 RepID=UPI003A8949AB
MGSKRSDRIKEDDEEEEDRKQSENFYTRVYDDAVAKKTHLDNKIIEQTCEVGGGRVESLARVFSSGGEGAASHHAAYNASLAAIHQQRQRAHCRYAALVQNILTHESDLKAQEERREEGARLLQRQQEEAGIQEEKVQRLQELIHVTRRATASTTAKVATYSTYREYVERSVATFGKEASTVEGVCGRFRDLLTLRLQLQLKVNHALLQLHQARRQLQVFVQSEKEREGEALLQLYRERSAGWTSSRSLGEMEARLAALQTASTHTHTHLTRVRLALVNIYSVARAYQRSLPPLGPRAATSAVLRRLHNFLLDAMTVTAAARSAIQPASLRPSADSLTKPVRRENAPSKPPHKDSVRKDSATNKSGRDSVTSKSRKDSSSSSRLAKDEANGKSTTAEEGTLRKNSKKKKSSVGKLTKMESKRSIQRDEQTDTPVEKEASDGEEAQVLPADDGP